jgi:hypothetical protein
MLLCNDQIPLIKVNKTLNNTKIYTHIRSQTKKPLKPKDKNKGSNNNNNQSLSHMKQKKIPKLAININNNSVYIKKNLNLNLSKNKFSNNFTKKIPSIITEINTYTNNENNCENYETTYTKTLSNLTHIKLHSQTILTQKKDDKITEKENIITEREIRHNKYINGYKKYINNVERTRSGKKMDTQKTSPANSIANSIVSSFDEKNSFCKNIEEKRLNEILKSTKFNNNNNNESNNNIVTEQKEQKVVRSICDIKKECLATMKMSEKVQSRINDEGKKLINSLKEKYLKLTGKEEIYSTSNISSTFSTPCDPNKYFFSNFHNFLQLQDNINNINLGIFSLNYNNLYENNKLYNSNNFSIEEYNNLIDTITLLEYGPNILDEYFSEEEHLTNILINHSITPYMRMKMVDWMIEIFTTIPTKEITFFISVNIMDRFFYYSKKEYKSENLHLIGICSIFLAFKYSETFPIKLDFVVEKIAHNKFKKEEIIKMENEILITLNFSLIKPTLYEFTSFYFRHIFYCIENFYNIKNLNLRSVLKEYIDNYNINIDNELLLFEAFYDKCLMIGKYNDNMRRYVKSIVNYLLMMCMQDYDMVCEKKSLVGAAIIFVAMKICEEVNKEKYIDDYLIEKLKKLTKENQYNIMDLSSKILTRIQNYEKYYPGVNNLYNIYFQQLSQMKDTK